MKENTLKSNRSKPTKLRANLPGMKFFFLLIACLVLQIRIVPAQAQHAQITLKTGQTTLKDIISEVEKQTDYLFVYSASEVNVDEKVTIKKEKQKVAEVLALFNALGLSSNLSSNYITLGKGADPSGKKVKVSGKVLDSSGEPIIGANITVKGNPALGTITNAEGDFELTVDSKSTLQISYIGFRN